MGLSALVVGHANAGSFMVDPTRIELAPGQLSATLTIRNDDSEPAVIRAEARSWAQNDGEDLYQSSKEILVSPPIMTVAPGSEQIVRIALRRQLDPLKELSYRIFLQEVPAAPRPGFSGLQMALRISLPIFAKPASGVAPKAAWNVAYLTKDHALRVGMANEGNAHVQLQEFKLSTIKKADTLALQQTTTYLLPGQRHEWLIKLDPTLRISGDRLHLHASTDAGHLEQDLEIDSQP